MKKILMIILILFTLCLVLFTYQFFTKNRYITSDEAKKIAMNDVSNKDGKYEFNSIEFKETHNAYIYTIEFSDKVNYYIYKINAKSKKIIFSKKESLTNNKIYLDEEKILNIVYKHAKLDPNECNLIANLATLEGNITIYTTIFYYNNTKYEYKTNAFTGSIISVTKLNENAV